MLWLLSHMRSVKCLGSAVVSVAVESQPYVLSSAFRAFFVVSGFTGGIWTGLSELSSSLDESLHERGLAQLSGTLPDAITKAHWGAMEVPRTHVRLSQRTCFLTLLLLV